MSSIQITRPAAVAALCLLALGTAGCVRSPDGAIEYQSVRMWNDSRLKPLEQSPLPRGGSSSLMPPEGVVARGDIERSDPLVSGRRNGKLVRKIPLAVDHALLERGQNRYNVFCSPCHGLTGAGNGMIVSRGFPHPPDYGLQRLRDAPAGHYFEVVTHGYGVMYPYASRIEPEDRWAIISYIRLLQKKRPVVTEDPYDLEREQARQRDARGAPSPEQIEAETEPAPVAPDAAEPGATGSATGASTNAQE